MANNSNETDQINDTDLDAPTGLSDQQMEDAQGGMLGSLLGALPAKVQKAIDSAGIAGKLQGKSGKKLSQTLTSLVDQGKMSKSLANSIERETLRHPRNPF